MIKPVYPIVALLTVVIGLGGCATFRPVPQTLTGDGPVKQGTGESSFALFSASYSRAYQKAVDALGQGYDINSEPQENQLIYKRMAHDGFAVVRVNCMYFFSQVGEQQKWVDFGLDAIPVGGAIATGILALTNPATAIPAAIVTLVTTNTTSALKIYQKDFLFDTNNKANVQQLTLNALGSHYNSIFGPDSKIRWTFQGAVTAVQQHQSLCTASNMLTLVTQAITNASTSSTTPGTTTKGSTAPSGSTPSPAPAPTATANKTSVDK